MSGLISISLPEELLRVVRLKAKELDLPLSRFCRDAIVARLSWQPERPVKPTGPTPGEEEESMHDLFVRLGCYGKPTPAPEKPKGPDSIAKFMDAAREATPTVPEEEPEAVPEVV